MIHAINDAFDVCILQFIAVDDVVFGHDDCVMMVLKKTRSGEQVSISQSTQSHTRAKLSDEEFSAIVETNEPLIVLLEYTFACNSMLSQNSIEARLSGVRCM